MMDDSLQYELLYETVAGLSEVTIGGEKVFIRHLDFRSNLQLDYFYQQKVKEYGAKGIPSEKEKLEFLAEDGLWTPKDEDELKKARVFVQGLAKTRGKLIIESQKKEIDEEIKTAQKELLKKLAKRETLVGGTCEKYANKDREERTVFLNVFRDEGFTTPFWTDEDFEFADQSEVQEVFEVFYKCVSRFSDENMKKLALDPSFFNLFCLCPKDSPHVVFERPPFKLTIPQQTILVFAKRARSILENIEGVPEEIMGDYDELVAFSERKVKNSKNKHAGKGNSGRSVVGAKGKELQKAGIDTKGAVTPFELLRKSGKKSLSKKDFLTS